MRVLQRKVGRGAATDPSRTLRLKLQSNKNSSKENCSQRGCCYSKTDFSYPRIQNSSQRRDVTNPQETVRLCAKAFVRKTTARSKTRNFTLEITAAQAPVRAHTKRLSILQK